MSKQSFLNQTDRSANLDLDLGGTGEQELVDKRVKMSQSESILSKEAKLAALREQLSKRQDLRKSVIASNQPRGKDFYLLKVTNFLVSGFFLSLATELLFTYAYLHDYINGYFENDTAMFNGLIEGSTYCFLLYFIGRVAGYFLTAIFVITPIQEDEEFGRKVFTISLILSSLSIFVSTKLMHLKDYGVFCIFYALIPGFISSPVSLFLILNLAKLGIKNEINLKLLYTLQNMAYFASVVIMGLVRPWISGEKGTPLQINTRPKNSTDYFVRTLYFYYDPEAAKQFPARLSVFPVATLLSGLVGLGFLYGWNFSNKEGPAKEIAWDSIKVQKKMNAIKDLRINDVLDYLDGGMKRDEVDDMFDQDADYSMHTEPIDQNESVSASEYGNFGGQGGFLRENAKDMKKKFIKKEVSNESLVSEVKKKIKRDTSNENLIKYLEPVEDDARRFVEAQLGGKVINMNIDKERGEIIIAYRGSVKPVSIFEVIFCKQMIYLYISFSCSATITLFYISKLSRVPLTFFAKDDYVGPVIIFQSLLATFLMLLIILILHKRRSKKFMLGFYTMLNYGLLLLYTTQSESLPGVILLSASCMFIFVYMKVIMLFVVAVSARKSSLLIHVYPVFFSVLIVSSIIKALFVDRYADNFNQMMLSFLLIQGVAFLFMNGVDVERFQYICFEYAAWQEKKEQLGRK